MEICTNKCNMVTCVYRHPRTYRYFNNFGRCKFEDSCSYLHKKDDKTDQEKEIEKLGKDVEELNKQVNELRKFSRKC
jgi:hypothetical protein